MRSRHFSILLVSAWLVTSGSAQTWQWINPLPQGAIYAGIHFTDSLRGWSWTGAGTLLQTIDGGVSWTHQVVTKGSPIEYLGQMEFTPYPECWLTTSGGPPSIMKSQDGGLTWSSKSIPEFYTQVANANISGLVWLDAERVLISDDFGYIYLTTDDGATWREVYMSIPVRAVRSLHGLSSTAVFALRRGPLVATFDSGNTWQEINEVRDAKACYSLGDQSIWILTDADSVFRSTNGGQTWLGSRLAARFEGDGTIIFRNQHEGVILGYSSIARSIDGGSSWTIDTIGVSFSAGSYVPGSDIWAVGNYKLYRSTDFGDTWTLRTTSITNAQLRSIAFSDATTGWIAGDAGLLTTTNGGSTWAFIGEETGPLKDVAVLGTSGVTACGGGSVFSSTDRGLTWRKMDTPSPVGLLQVQQVTTNHVVVVGGDYTNWGSAGIALLSGDGGTTWQVRTPPNSGILTGLHFFDPLNGLVLQAGNSFDRSILYRTTDAGMTWSRPIDTVGVELGAIYFIHPLHGWASVGKDIWTTTDGGISWIPRGTSTRTAATAIVFLDGLRGIAGSRIAEFSTTSDGGISWRSIPTVADDLHDMIIHDNRVWAVGSLGTIFSRDLDDLVTHSETARQNSEGRFQLAGIYPTPFNHAVKVLVNNGLRHQTIQFKVYDLQGRLVRVAFTGEVGPGTTVLEWDGRDSSNESVASGIYFAQIVTETGRMAAKLLLLR